MLLITIVLGVFLVLVLLLLLTALMNIWIGVPSVPTPMPIVRAMIDLADLQGHETIVDLGAGDGRLLIEAKRQYPGICARGWEIIPTIWLIGKIRIFYTQLANRLLGRHGMPPLQLYCRDALKADVSDADVIFLYLFPSLIAELLPRFDTQLKPGTRVISHTFKLPGKTPVSEKRMKGYMGETSVFVYQW